MRPSRLLVSLFCAMLAVCPALGQNFANPKVVPTGNWPAAVYTADVNGDGYPDLIYIYQGATAGQPSATHVLLNDGHGNFTPAKFSVETAGNCLAIADVNGDGIPDLAWLSFNALSGVTKIGAFVAFGNGDGTFQAASSFWTVTASSQSVNPAHLQAGHISHRSGFMELAFDDTANQTLYVMEASILLNPSGQGGAVASRQLSGSGPITLADLNGDGLQDVIQQGTTSVAVFLGSSSNNQLVASSPLPFTAVSGINSLLIKDVNLDGVPDLIAEGGNGHIDVFFGNGDGTFQTTSSGGTGPVDGTTGNGGQLIATGDFNHDGQLDALTATPIGVSTLLGQGTQYLGLKGIYNAGPAVDLPSTTYAVADFNGDGNQDVALPSPEGIAILYGNGDGSFQTSQAFAAGQPAMSGALAALTTSGHVDAIVSTGSAQAQLLLGDGSGNFTALGGASSPSPTTPQNGQAGLWGVVHTGVFFDAILPDIAITADGGSSAANGGTLIPSAGASPPSGLIYQRNNGDGTFAPPQGVTGPVSSQQTAASPAPFYGVSAVEDLVFPSVLYTRDSSAYRYTGDVFQPYPLVGSHIFGSQTTLTDHAHNLIAVTPAKLAANTIIVTEQDGDLFVRDGDLLSTPLVGDLAVDGSATTAGQLVAPDISASFPGMSHALGFRAFPGSAVIDDLDRDKNADLIVAYDNLDAGHTAPDPAHPNKIYIWFGSGNDKFLASAAHPVNPVVLTPSRNFYQVQVADMNGDGIPDLILSDGYIVSIQLGKGDGTFGAEQHYLGGQGINTISIADVNNDGKPDIVLANGGAILTNPVANLEKLATNPDVNTGGITVLLNQATTLPALSGSVTATPEPSTYGNQFLLTGTAPGPGQFAFSVDGTAIGSVASSSNTASAFAPGTFAVGFHTLGLTWTAQLSGVTAQFTGTHQILQAPTSLSLLLCVDPPGSQFPCGTPLSATPLISPITFYFGQSLDGVAEESGTNLGGNIIFYDNTNIFCTIPANLSSGSNMCPTQSGYFNAGTYTVYASYTGDSNNLPSQSNSIQVIVYPDPTSGSLQSSANPAVVGTNVTFTATLAGNFATPAGTVNFYDGTPSNATLLGSGTLNASGTATFSTASLAVGTYTIYAVYAATANFAGIQLSMTQVITPVVVTPPPPTGNGYTLTVSPNPVTVGAGATGILLVTVAGQSSQTPQVALSCSGLPVETACTFLAPTLPAGGGATTLELHVSAPHDCGSETPYFVGSESGPASPVPYTLAAALLGSVAIYRRRRLLHRRGRAPFIPQSHPEMSGSTDDAGTTLLLVLIALVSLASLSGCGHCTDLGTRPGSYSFTVIATPDGTSTSGMESVTVPLTVTIP